MQIARADRGLALQEFRLLDTDRAGTVEGIVAALQAYDPSAVPLLTSVDDARDVATVRVASDGSAIDHDDGLRAAVAPFVASWRPLAWYASRIAERGRTYPVHFRLAVTGPGIDHVDARALSGGADGASTPIGLLWIGAPVGTDAGLLVLVGDHGDGPFGPAGSRSTSPLPLSRRRGVRIYESGARRIVRDAERGADPARTN